MNLRGLINQIMDGGALDLTMQTLYDSYYTNKDKEYDKNGMVQAYTGVVRELIELPHNPIDHKLLVRSTVETKGDEPVISVILEHDDSTYGVDFVLWEELIDADVLDESMHMLPHDILAHILWEITFYGFSAARVKQKKVEMDELVASTERGDDLEEFKLEDL